jgi:hypothetical protein
MAAQTKHKPEEQPPTYITPLHMALPQFISQILAVIEINESTIPELESRESELISALTSKMEPVLKGSAYDEFERGIEWFRESLTNMAEGDSSRHTTITFKNAMASRAFIVLLQESHSNVAGGTQASLLRKSLLISSISAFEVLFGSVAEEIYKVNKSALNDSDYAFTLQELAEFATLDDARSYLSERRISSLLRESIDGWDKWLKKASGGISMTDLPVDWPAIREIFARRNLMVHTGGQVNHLYLEMIGNKRQGGSSGQPRVGDYLEVDQDYLADSAEMLIALGTLLVLCVAVKLHRSHRREVAGDILGRVEILVRHDRWKSSGHICKYLSRCDLERQKQITAMTLAWLCQKRLGDGSYLDELRNWDTSGLDPILAVRKSLLLGNIEEAIPEIKKLLKDERLTLLDIALDPVFAEVVAHLEVPGDPETDAADSA